MIAGRPVLVVSNMTSLAVHFHASGLLLAEAADPPEYVVSAHQAHEAGTPVSQDEHLEAFSSKSLKDTVCIRTRSGCLERNQCLIELRCDYFLATRME